MGENLDKRTFTVQCQSIGLRDARGLAPKLMEGEDILELETEGLSGFQSGTSGGNLLHFFQISRLDEFQSSSLSNMTSAEGVVEFIPVSHTSYACQFRSTNAISRHRNGGVHLQSSITKRMERMYTCGISQKTNIFV